MTMTWRVSALLLQVKSVYIDLLDITVQYTGVRLFYVTLQHCLVCMSHAKAIKPVRLNVNTVPQSAVMQNATAFFFFTPVTCIVIANSAIMFESIER